MHIVWDQVPRWRKQANDEGEKNRRAKQAKQRTGGGSSIPRSVSARPVTRDH